MKIRDNETGEVFEYGTNIHHVLRISKDGKCLYFENLQNGDGSNGGGYSFVLDDGKTLEESESEYTMYGDTYANIGGFVSTDIEKILQEIENLKKLYSESGLSLMDKGNLPCEYDSSDIESEKVKAISEVMEIIKKHLSENHCSECSRRKFYQIGIP